MRLIGLICLCLLPLGVAAQPQRIAYMDSDYILSRMPEYTGLDQRLRTSVQEWNQELTAMKAEIDRLEQEFNAREILFTAEVRQQRLADIQTKKRPGSSMSRPGSVRRATISVNSSNCWNRSNGG